MLGQSAAVQSTSDFSYSAPPYASNHYPIVADPGYCQAMGPSRSTGDVLPQPNAHHSFHRCILFKLGVYIPVTGSLSTVIPITASIRGKVRCLGDCADSVARAPFSRKCLPCAPFVIPCASICPTTPPEVPLVPRAANCSRNERNYYDEVCVTLAQPVVFPDR